MDAARKSWLLPFVAVGALSIVVAHNHINAARLSGALGLERRKHLEWVSLQRQNLDLAAHALPEIDPEKLKARLTETEALRARLSALRRKAPDDNGNGEAQSLPAKDWTYAGRGSPKAALQSVLWAASRGDTDRLASLVGFAPELRGQADAIYSQLPAESQQEYGSAEKVVATLLAGSFPKDAQSMQILVDRQFGDQEASVVMSVSHADGGSKTNLFRFHNTPGGWQLLIPASVMKGYEETLQRDQ